MATGKILRFDEIRGYGFIAPDSGGEDVFLHANALLAEKHQYHPGVPVEFDVIEGERGLKATAVRVVRGRVAPTPAPPGVPGAPAATSAKPTAVPSPAMQAPATHGPAAAPQPATVPTPGPPGPAPAAQPHTSSIGAANGSVATATPSVLVTPATVTPATVAAATQGTHVITSVSSPAIAQQRSSPSTERPTRDPVPADQLGAELVELCLESVPSMTGEQITQLRRAVITLARRHGWVSE